MPFFDLSAEFFEEKVPILGPTLKWMREAEIEFGIPVTVIAVLLLYFAFSNSDTLMASSIGFYFALAPLWLPYMTLDFFHFRWMDYIGKSFYLYNGRTTLRLNLPPEVIKSPMAMELVLTHAWNIQNPDNLMQTYIDGKKPQQIALELVSIGGDVRFYVNINTKKAKETFIPTMYAHYPGVEIIEEPVDYAAEIPLGDPDWDLMSTHMTKKEGHWGPIKTYVEFGLDQVQKEEEKTDPMLTTLEQLATIGPHERLYIQFICIGFRKSSFKNGQLMFGEGPKWQKMAQAHVDELMQRDPDTKAPLNAGETDFEGAPRVTPGEREDIEVIERNMTKHAYYVGCKHFYLAKKGHFDSLKLNAFNKIFSQYDSAGRCEFGVRWRTDFNYMWISDPFGDRLKKMKFQEHKEYKLRKYNPKNTVSGPKIFTVEELATMFHLPGTVALTPGMSRISSNRAEAPTNLPIGTLPTRS